jgi:mono/diheme cytochrome c family protein
MRSTTLSTFLFVLILLTGCGNPRESAKGFKLPDGNAEAGKTVYAAMNCKTCHSIRGVSDDAAPVGVKTLKLGGLTTKLPTDGYLVTAIINPSHDIKKQAGIESTLPSGESRMINFNDALTVRQLIDLVSYLQTIHEFDTAYEGHGLP